MRRHQAVVTDHHQVHQSVRTDPLRIEQTIPGTVRRETLDKPKLPIAKNCCRLQHQKGLIACLQRLTVTILYYQTLVAAAAYRCMTAGTVAMHRRMYRQPTTQKRTLFVERACLQTATFRSIL